MIEKNKEACARMPCHHPNDSQWTLGWVLSLLPNIVNIETIRGKQDAIPGRVRGLPFTCSQL